MCACAQLYAPCLPEVPVGPAEVVPHPRLVMGRPGLFIEASGADRDPLPADCRLRSLKGTAGARVVRALFDAKPPLQVSELAGRAGVSTAQSSRVADLLDREAVLQRDPRGSIIAVDRTKLIERWAEDYSFLDANATGAVPRAKNARQAPRSAPLERTSLRRQRVARSSSPC